MRVSEEAGRPADPAHLADIPALVSAYYEYVPDPADPAERVTFGTSGHRGSSPRTTFNERHILAITQAICGHRRRQGITGPLFLGRDTHALSHPALLSALEVLAANEVEVRIAEDDGYTPTPVISHAILRHNAGEGRAGGLADGIVITPSHNPPEDGGFKYNPPHGGPAETAVTAAIEREANALLADPARLRRMPLARALRAASVRRHDFVSPYVDDLAEVIDLECVRASGLRIAIDALGGAGLRYWHAIAERYRLDFAIRNDVADPTFRFMTLDWDGRIRMDPSSAHAMHSLIDMREEFDLAAACDTDHDRHGIVTRKAGLLPANHYLAVCTDYLFAERSHWRHDLAVGRTAVTSEMIDRVARSRGRAVHEVPAGFKWFTPGLTDGMLGFVGEESAGATFLRRDGNVWTTDKDGIIAALLAAEMTARTGRDPGELYAALETSHGRSWYSRIDAPAGEAERRALLGVKAETIALRTLADDPVTRIATTAADGNPLGGIKVGSARGWFAARPSGTEDIYKIYAESFVDDAHLRRIKDEAAALIERVFAGAAVAEGQSR